eukprot:SM000263S09818  [mRNA]  locus=s263:128645:130335:- [translate_table: standard]
MPIEAAAIDAAAAAAAVEAQDFCKHSKRTRSGLPRPYLVGRAHSFVAVFVPNFAGARVNSLPITDSNRHLLRSGYVARRSGELALNWSTGNPPLLSGQVLARWFPALAVEAPEAKVTDHLKCPLQMAWNTGPRFCLPFVCQVSTASGTFEGIFEKRVVIKGLQTNRATPSIVHLRMFQCATYSGDYVLVVALLLGELQFLDIILYSREQLENERATSQPPESTETTTPLPDAPWGIICIKAQDVDYELPMSPITMMRNALGTVEGGSGVALDRKKYEESVKFWDSHANITGGL